MTPNSGNNNTSDHDTHAKLTRTYDSLHFCCPVILHERNNDGGISTRTHTRAPIRLTHERITDATAWERSHSINPTLHFLRRATSTPILFTERRLAHRTFKNALPSATLPSPASSLFPFVSLRQRRERVRLRRSGYSLTCPPRAARLDSPQVPLNRRMLYLAALSPACCAS